MNKTNIEWSDYSWNPITGCKCGCEYCYAERMAKRFTGDIRNNMLSDKCKTESDIYVIDEPFKNEEGTIINYPFGFKPTYHKYRLDWPEKVKCGANIFVGSMADIFGEWVPDYMIAEIFEHCKKFEQHNYLFLTKNPRRYIELAEKGILPNDKNMWYGTTTTTPSEPWFYSDQHNTFVSAEPIHGYFDGIDDVCKKTDWIILGAETGNRKNKIVPHKEWFAGLVNRCNANGIPVFMKDSLIPIVGEENMLREYPKPLKNSRMSEKMKQKLFDKCMYCNKELRMKEMIALLYREKRGESPKRLGYACKKCFKTVFGGVLSEKTKLQNDE